MNAVVVASNRPEYLELFLEKWSTELRKVKVYVILDLPEKRDFNFHGLDVSLFCWADIDADLGEVSWVIPRYTSGIKSYGILKAWQNGAGMIACLDDDCFPDTPRYIERHWENLKRNVHPDWHSTLDVPPNRYPRGFPYEIRGKFRTVGISHGLWSNIPDYDAVTASRYGKDRTALYDPPRVEVVPVDNFFPMCGMNVAFRREIAPVMYFGLQGKEYPYDRFDDIWCGLFAKKILDHLGYSVTNGGPYIRHERASEVSKNLVKEQPGMAVNERLWKAVKTLKLRQATPGACLVECADALPSGEYWRKLRQAMRIWVSLFDNED